VLAGEGLGKGLRATRVRFGVLGRSGTAPASGSPVDRECGRGGGSERRGSSREWQSAVRVASRGLVEGEKS
jgi:hypothetical protein